MIEKTIVIRPSYVSIFVLGDPEYCNWVDCSKEYAHSLCPVTCSQNSEPHWCRVGDCSKPEAIKFCKQTCGNKGNASRVGLTLQI